MESPTVNEMIDAIKKNYPPPRYSMLREALDHAIDLMKAESEGGLLVLNKQEEDAYAGLKRKYIVLKADTGEGVDNCFVLRPDKDHAAKVALEAYAKETENKTLAEDIINWIGDSGRVLPRKQLTNATSVGWVSIKDKLPEENEYVLVTDGSEFDIAYRLFDKYICEYTVVGCSIYDFPYWLPIPKIQGGQPE